MRSRMVADGKDKKDSWRGGQAFTPNDRGTLGEAPNGPTVLFRQDCPISS